MSLDGARPASALTMASAIERSSCGSKHDDGSSSTSGSDVRFDEMVGTPQAAASRTGRPTPSSTDGITDSDAPWSTATSSSSSSAPVKTTRSPTPASRAHDSQRRRTSDVCAVAITRWWRLGRACSTSAHARIRPSVFLRSSPPVTATTYASMSAGALGRLVVGGRRPTARTSARRPSRWWQSDRTDSPVRSTRSWRRTPRWRAAWSTVRASGARSCDCRSALASTRYVSGKRYGITSYMTAATGSRASATTRGIGSSAIGCSINWVATNQVPGSACCRITCGLQRWIVRPGTASMSTSTSTSDPRGRSREHRRHQAVQQAGHPPTDAALAGRGVIDGPRIHQERPHGVVGVRPRCAQDAAVPEAAASRSSMSAS